MGFSVRPVPVGYLGVDYMMHQDALPLLPPITNPDDRVDLDVTDSIKIDHSASMPTVSES